MQWDRANNKGADLFQRNKSALPLPKIFHHQADISYQLSKIRMFAPINI
jgi:hypothetical protein